MWQAHTDGGGQLPLQPGTAYCSVPTTCTLHALSRLSFLLLVVLQSFGMRLADIVIYYIMSQIAEPWSSGSNIDAIIIETSSRTWPPIAAV